MHTVATTYTNLTCITSHIFMQVLLITSSLLFLWMVSVYSYNAAALYYMHSMDKMDVDQLAILVLEEGDSSCLVFCPTKKNCQNMALLLAKLLPR